MKKLFLLFFFALSCLGAGLPLVTGTFQDQFGNQPTITNVFKMLSPQSFNGYGSYTLYSTNIATNGTFSSVFQPGPWMGWIGPRHDLVYFIVPNDTNTHDFWSLVTNGVVNVSGYGGNFYYIYLLNPATNGEAVVWNGSNWVAGIASIINSNPTFDSSAITFDSSTVTFDQ
jgi:hypothetical protein